MTNQKVEPDVRTYVREHYGQIAEQFQEKEASCGCGTSSSACCAPSNELTQSDVTRIYQIPEVDDLPEDVTGLSLGCGDPVTLASLLPGQSRIQALSLT